MSFLKNWAYLLGGEKGYSMVQYMRASRLRKRSDGGSGQYALAAVVGVVTGLYIWQPTFQSMDQQHQLQPGPGEQKSKGVSQPPSGVAGAAESP